ncbi:MAG: hypothetical protein WCP16_10230 [Pseudanabaena sp. ELA645]|jgi:hypothetical protein
MSAIANSNRPEDKPKTSRVKSYWHTFWHNSPWKKLASLVMAIALCFYLTACGGEQKTEIQAPVQKVETTGITEVSPPAEIQRLSRLLDSYEPQVSIVSPKPDQVLDDTQVSVKFDVKNLPIFKNADFGLGPHIHVTLDNQEYKAVYDLNQTATFDHLSAGTHIIRAFASRPWHESFKNQGAYAQTTFHVLTKTGENTPAAKTPLLTYSRPVGSYGAEPIMLDFYLQNAPLHLLTQDLDKAEDINNDWKVRATIDGQTFTFDRWEPMYLKGFKQGKNWVKLELIEEDGDEIANVFNSTAHLINFQPNGQDTLSRLVSGEKIVNIDAIVNPDYVPPTPEPSPTPTPVESVSPAPTTTPAPTATEAVTETTTAPIPTPALKVESPKAEIKTIDKAPVAPVKVAPEEIAPPVVAPIVSPVVAPIKGKSEPVKELVKVEPLKVIKPEPIKPEPIKPETIKPEPIKLKTSSEPVKAIAPSPSLTISTEKSPKAIAPSTAASSKKDYLKDIGFTQKKVFSSHKTEVPTTPIDSPVITPDAKATENASVLTDLSATTSTPIKVLTKSSN